MRFCENHLSRRDLIKGIGAGAMGLTLGGGLLLPRRVKASPGSPLAPKDQLFKKEAPPAKVVLLRGTDRRELVLQALKKIEDQILPAIENKRILVKPNFVITTNPLCATHVDAVRGVLDFLKPHHKQQITIGESSAEAQTARGFTNYGYTALEKEYDVKLVDLNTQPWEYRYFVGRDNTPVGLQMISAFYEPNQYIISVAKMKSHDRVVTTLSLKNLLMAVPLVNNQQNSKQPMHQEDIHTPKSIIHYNLFQLAQEVYPDLGVIDGVEAMEGDGPVNGTPVDTRLVMASTDPLAMDILATKLMGFDPNKIIYLTSMARAGMGQGNLEKVEVLGAPVAECQFKFKPARQIAESYGLLEQTP
jgi:uncharacterized protein (DUF362 family)